jgi:hypothetical protein
VLLLLYSVTNACNSTHSPTVTDKHFTRDLYLHVQVTDSLLRTLEQLILSWLDSTSASDASPRTPADLVQRFETGALATELIESLLRKASLSAHSYWGGMLESLTSATAAAAAAASAKSDVTQSRFQELQAVLEGYGTGSIGLDGAVAKVL